MLTDKQKMILCERSLELVMGFTFSDKLRSLINGENLVSFSVSSDNVGHWTH